MRRSVRFALLAVALAVAGCATGSTSFVATWRSPSASAVQPTGRKVLALFLDPASPVLRRAAEDAMVRELAARGAEGAPAYAVLGDAAMPEAAARSRLAELGFSGVLVMRLIGEETEYHLDADPWWTGLQSHLWGGYWGCEVAHARAEPDRIVSVETLVYSLEGNGELLWAGESRTVNPERVEALISELSGEVTRELVRAGLLAPPERAGSRRSPS